MNVRWGEHPWEEIRDYAEEGALAVAPFGSTEQHGPMLPLDTDIHIADRPHLVRRDRMVRPTLKVDSRPEWAWQTPELSEIGAFGDPCLASAELGDTWAQPVALFLKRLWEEPLE